MTENRTAIAKASRLIPRPAKIVAALAFAGLLSLALIPDWDGSTPPLSLRVIILSFAGLVVAALVLLVGFVNGDAKRRGMNSLLWTLLVIFVPNGIGFIIYFLTRQPMLPHCPQCSTRVKPEFNFCPKCNLKLAPTCPKCQHTISASDHYCPYCGQALAEYNQSSAPAEAGCQSI